VLLNAGILHKQPDRTVTVQWNSDQQTWVTAWQRWQGSARN